MRDRWRAWKYRHGIVKVWPFHNDRLEEIWMTNRDAAVRRRG